MEQKPRNKTNLYRCRHLLYRPFSNHNTLHRKRWDNFKFNGTNTNTQEDSVYSFYLLTYHCKLENKVYVLQDIKELRFWDFNYIKIGVDAISKAISYGFPLCMAFFLESLAIFVRSLIDNSKYYVWLVSFMYSHVIANSYFLEISYF